MDRINIDRSRLTNFVLERIYELTDDDLETLRDRIIWATPGYLEAADDLKAKLSTKDEQISTVSTVNGLPNHTFFYKLLEHTLAKYEEDKVLILSEIQRINDRTDYLQQRVIAINFRVQQLRARHPEHAISNLMQPTIYH